MTEAGFEVLQAAVRVARDQQIASVPALRCALNSMGYDDAVITEALITWGRYCRRMGPPLQ